MSKGYKALIAIVCALLLVCVIAIPLMVVSYNSQRQIDKLEYQLDAAKQANPTAMATTAVEATLTPAVTVIPDPTTETTPEPTAEPTTDPAVDMEALLKQITVTKNGKKLQLEPRGDGWLFYDETGKDKTAKYEITIPKGTVVILDSLVLNGVSNGHLKAYDANVKVKLHNGAIGICLAEDGSTIFTDRYTVLDKNNWAKSEVTPLKVWNWIAPKKEE